MDCGGLLTSVFTGYNDNAMYLFRLIRWPNLLIVILTQYLLYQFVLVSQLVTTGRSPLLSISDFFALTIATICTAAAGYIINDIYDQVIDTLNKPEKMVVGKLLSERAAYIWYGGFIAAGFLGIVYLTVRTGHWFWIPGYAAANAMMYAYSWSWKKQVLIGNFVVSLFCAMVAIVVVVGEGEVLTALLPQHSDVYGKILSVFIGYAIFAFLSTMYREIVKDMEDMKGDEVNHCRTLPIAVGVNKAKSVAAFFAIGLLLCAYYWAYLLFISEQYPHLIYLMGGIILPAKFSLLWLGSAETKEAFHRLSTLTKLIMLGGILYLVLEAGLG